MSRKTQRVQCSCLAPAGTFWQAFLSEVRRATAILSLSARLFLPHVDSPAWFTTQPARGRRWSKGSFSWWREFLFKPWSGTPWADTKLCPCSPAPISYSSSPSSSYSVPPALLELSHPAFPRHVVRAEPKNNPTPRLSIPVPSAQHGHASPVGVFSIKGWISAAYRSHPARAAVRVRNKIANISDMYMPSLGTQSISDLPGIHLAVSHLQRQYLAQKPESFCTSTVSQAYK